MNAKQPRPWDPCLSGNESSYFIGPFENCTETDSDAPGPGRFLGKAYGVFGNAVERIISSLAIKIGCHLCLTAMRVRRLKQENTLPVALNRKKLKKDGKWLVTYVR